VFFFYDLLPNYESKFSSEPIVLEDCFFGFHDVKPFSNKNSRLLSNRLTIPLRMPTKDDVLEVGYWYGDNFSECYTKYSNLHHVILEKQLQRYE